MATKYDEVNNQILLRSRQNDDIILEVLNLFALFINSGEYQPYDEMMEVKFKLNSAFEQYEVLMNALRLQNQYTFRYQFDVDDSAKEKYNQLIDRNRDNIEA